MKILFLGLLLIVGVLIISSQYSTDEPSQSSKSNPQAQKELIELMQIAKEAELVRSYEFSKVERVIYVNNAWYQQDVKFKKDFLAKASQLLDQATGYHWLYVRDAFSNEKVAEVTAFSGSLEVYK